MKSDLTAPESALPQALVTGDHVFRVGTVQGDPNTGYLSEGWGQHSTHSRGRTQRRARVCVHTGARVKAEGQGSWAGDLCCVALGSALCLSEP